VWVKLINPCNVLGVSGCSGSSSNNYSFLIAKVESEVRGNEIQWNMRWHSDWVIERDELGLT
jgi:hypothetical protein